MLAQSVHAHPTSAASARPAPGLRRADARNRACRPLGLQTDAERARPHVWAGRGTPRCLRRVFRLPQLASLAVAPQAPAPAARCRHAIPAGAVAVVLVAMRALSVAGAG